MNQSINQVFLEILGKMYLTFFVSLHSFIFAEINFFRRVFHSETVFMSESPSFFTYKEIGLTLSGPTVCKKVHPQFLLLRKAINIELIRPKFFYFSYYYVVSPVKNVLAPKPHGKRYKNIFVKNFSIFYYWSNQILHFTPFEKAYNIGLLTSILHFFQFSLKLRLNLILWGGSMNQFCRHRKGCTFLHIAGLDLIFTHVSKTGLIINSITLLQWYLKI